VLLDLLALVLLAGAALLGAFTGALRQLVQLGAVVLAWLAARQLGPPVAAGFARSMPGMLARPGASIVLFLGVFALATLAGAVALRATRLSSAVRGPADRGVGALLGGAKGALALWVLLSATLLAGRAVPGPARLRQELARSDLAALAREHNLLLRVHPGAARTLDRLLSAGRDGGGGGLADDPEARRLLEDPRVRPLVGREPDADPGELERALEDPDVARLVEGIRSRAAERERAAAPR
jgi:membrane protein required for colicin V production